ncbi:hypothetical protein GOP47_0029634, partial [Adiantum capillus-veneris]
EKDSVFLHEKISKSSCDISRKLPPSLSHTHTPRATLFPASCRHPCMTFSSSSRASIIISASFDLLLIINITFFCAIFLSPSPCRAHENLQFSFPMFDHNQLHYLNFSSNSNVDKQALQITPNSGSRDVSNISGQITYGAQALQLWHESYNYTASFNTSFLINMGPIMGGGTNDSGGGMTFMLTSLPAIKLFPNSSGPLLGLIDGRPNSSKDQGAAQFVAIEFDTFKDSFDPDGNHVGIDVNGSVNSSLAISLSPLNISLTDTSTSEGMYTNVWIEYDGSNYILDVYLANQGPELLRKPTNPIISGYPINLRDHLPQYVYVGFSASLGTILESHCVLRWDFNSTNFPQELLSSPPIFAPAPSQANLPQKRRSPHTARMRITLVGSVVACIVLLVVLIAILLVRRRRINQRLMGMEDLTNLHCGPRKFAYKDLKRATNRFSKDSSLGRGGFGEVYKGVLRSNNGITTEVAVKCLSQKSKQGEKEFKAEIMSMGRMRHKNLVQLLGWSYGSRRRLMLVYEYLPNRSLDWWIGQGRQEAGGEVEVMGWERRFHVMKGLAAGLLYLHEEWEMVVIHRDLKPSNVMLDADFNARIGDFGLAKFIKMEQESAHMTATIAGTFGYMAPESIEQGIVSKECDIYSLGAIAIELTTGHRISIDFLHRLLHLLEESSLEEAADPRLSSFDSFQLELLLRLGLACCHPHPPARPCIRDVVHALSTSGSSPAAMAVPSLSSFSSSYASSIHPNIPMSDSSVAAMEISAGR